MYKSGFVNIIGRPNVGKSTLMNALVGERMSIITSKPQTTRHRIIGILTGENWQIVFSDTPGFVEKPAYKMHEAMNSFVKSTFEDGDVMLFVTDPTEVFEMEDPFFQQICRLSLDQNKTLYLIINKCDAHPTEGVEKTKNFWREHAKFTDMITISAKEKTNTAFLLEKIVEKLPEGPQYYPEDQLTDRPERFFVSEIIREKILLNYRDEIPYSSEVAIEAYKETHTKTGEPLARIMAIIFVMRETQKTILIGKDGKAIKKLGSDARRDLEIFLQSKVFLELTVKVRENWRDSDLYLKNFGYN